MSAMYMLADVINGEAKRNLKLVLACHGPICYNASVLIDSCTRIRIQNIVAITSDVGLSALSVAAKQMDINLENVSGPPVWGFIGLNQFIDVGASIICSDIYRPYQRAIHSKSGSTLPLGTIVPELRCLTYMMDVTDNIEGNVKIIHNIISHKLGRLPTYAKVRATISLLKLWFAKDASDDIISLGVCSNGRQFIFYS